MKNKVKISFCGIILAATLFPGVSLAQSRLGNADILKMVNAGLDEKTIILSIQNTPGSYDTSVDGLINLKSSGVSQSIINAIQEAQATPPATRSIGTNDDSQGNRINIEISAVTMLTDDGNFLMKRRRPETRAASGLLNLMTGLGQSKKKASINGPKSNLRTTDTTPEFEVALPFDVDPTDYFVLVKLKTKKDRREVETGRSGLGANLAEGARVKDGFRAKDKVAVTYTEISTANGTTTYRGSINASLETGKEYALVYQQFFYDFGVDS